MHIDSDRSQFNPSTEGKSHDESTLNSALMSFSVGSPDALRKLEEGAFWLERIVRASRASRCAPFRSSIVSTA